MSPTTRILVAEPDPAERRRVVEIITRLGEEFDQRLAIDQASDGTMAMAAWGERPPQLVVCEILLEGISGLALLRRMKDERGPLPPVIFVTTMSRDSDRYWGLRNGAHAYLAKPYDDHQLRERIRQILQHGADAPPDPLWVDALNDEDTTT